MSSSSNVMDLQTYALNEIGLKLMDISSEMFRLKNLLTNEAFKREAFENMVKQHLSIGNTGLTETPEGTGLDNGWTTSPSAAVIPESTNELMQRLDERRLVKIDRDASVSNSLQSPLQSPSTSSEDQDPAQLPSTSTNSTSTSPLTAAVREPTNDLMQTPGERRLVKIESDASVPNSSQSLFQPPSTISNDPVQLPSTSANSRVKSLSLRRSVKPKPLTQSSSPSAETVENTPPADEDSPYDSDDDDDFVTPRFKIRIGQAGSQSRIKLKRPQGSLSTQADSSAFGKNTINKCFFISQGNRNTTFSLTSGKQKPKSSTQNQLPTPKSERKVKFNFLPKHRNDFSSPGESSEHQSLRNLRSASQDTASQSSQQQQSSEIRKQIFICHIPDCKKEYSTKSTLRRHLKKHQESVGGFLKCPVQTCEKVFSNQHTFQKHGFSHTGISLYVCNHCKPEKHFATKKDKEQHLQLGSHTSE